MPFEPRGRAWEDDGPGQDRRHERARLGRDERGRRARVKPDAGRAVQRHDPRDQRFARDVDPAANRCGDGVGRADAVSRPVLARMVPDAQVDHDRSPQMPGGRPDRDCRTLQ